MTTLPLTSAIEAPEGRLKVHSNSIGAVYSSMFDTTWIVPSVFTDRGSARSVPIFVDADSLCDFTAPALACGRLNEIQRMSALLSVTSLLLSARGGSYRRRNREKPSHPCWSLPLSYSARCRLARSRAGHQRPRQPRPPKPGPQGS